MPETPVFASAQSGLFRTTLLPSHQPKIPVVYHTKEGNIEVNRSCFD